jgi:hypothetical protein
MRLSSSDWAEAVDLEVSGDRAHPTVWTGRPTTPDPSHIHVRDRTVRPNRNPGAAVEDMGRSRASPQDLTIQAYPSQP